MIQIQYIGEAVFYIRKYIFTVSFVDVQCVRISNKKKLDVIHVRL